jgi:hypothetical protein
MLSFFNRLAATFKRDMNYLGDTCWLLIKHQAPLLNPGKIEEVLNHTDYMVELPFHHPLDIFDLVRCRRHLEDFKSRPYRRERVPHLMR